MIQILHERLEPALDKYHLNHPDLPSSFFPPDVRPAVHGIYVDPTDPHDHSWDFTSFVMCGGYEEEVYEQVGGVWRMKLVERLPLQAYNITAEHIHRVTRLLDGPCRTLVMHGPLRRKWRYYPEALDALKNPT